MGVPYFYVLALISAVGEMIPMVGPILAAIPAILVAVTVSPGLAIGVAVFFIVQQQLENTILVPKIMGRQVGLSAVTVIVALGIGSELLGVVGAILSVPDRGDRAGARSKSSSPPTTDSEASRIGSVRPSAVDSAMSRDAISCSRLLPPADDRDDLAAGGRARARRARRPRRLAAQHVDSRLGRRAPAAVADRTDVAARLLERQHLSSRAARARRSPSTSSVRCCRSCPIYHLTGNLILCYNLLFLSYVRRSRASACTCWCATCSATRGFSARRVRRRARSSRSSRFASRRSRTSSR